MMCWKFFRTAFYLLQDLDGFNPYRCVKQTFFGKKNEKKKVFWKKETEHDPKKKNSK
jgi:hypothetical protein